ncbi:MAG: Sua5/YciO/YrdC/YwlC family protein, partial [Chitinophagaceae bacterium]
SEIAPQLNRVGVMLPANALLDLVVHDFGKPLIATSANLSGSPIIYQENDDTLEYLLSIADLIVANNRSIIVPQDDSVLSFPKEAKKPVLMRRSRGFAPIYNNELLVSDKCLLSFGALLKSTFSLSIHKHIFVSQYLGGGENYEFQESYKKALCYFLQLYKAQPQCMIADIHPNYFTHQLAKEMSQERGVEYFTVQHHKAHFTAVLAENKLLDITEKVLGIIWDGTGLGTDGNIWGSECFIFEKNTIKRVSHFQYFTHIAGDQFALQSRLSLLSILGKEAYVTDSVITKFTAQELFVYKKLIEEKRIKTSSAGRFIDAVACILDLCNSITYEGEAAMYLQVEAEKYFYKHGYSMTEGYADFSYSEYIDIQIILKKIIKDKNCQVDTGFIAAKFHYSLVQIIQNMAEKQGVKKLCFSGGVFQNTLLIFLLKYHLSKNCQLYFHHQLSPNDENISLGQLFYIDRGIDK